MTTVNMSKTEYMDNFLEKAKELSKTKIKDCPPVQDRMVQVDEMVDEYFNFIGDMPAGSALDRLGSYILVNELKDRDVDKVTNNEYPIMSETQIKRRDRKHISVEADTMDFLNSKFNREMDTLAKTPDRKSDI